MSFDYDQEMLNEQEMWFSNEQTSQGGVYGIFVDQICVYVGKASKGKTSCLAHRMAQHWCGIYGAYTSNKGGLNMYDCLSYWMRTGHHIEFKYKTLSELTDAECGDCIPLRYRGAYKRDPLGMAESFIMSKYDPVLNTRKPIGFSPALMRFWDDDFDIKEQLRASDIDWIRAAADIKPKYF